MCMADLCTIEVTLLDAAVRSPANVPLPGDDQGCIGISKIRTQLRCGRCIWPWAYLVWTAAGASQTRKFGSGCARKRALRMGNNNGTAVQHLKSVHRDNSRSLTGRFRCFHRRNLCAAAQGERHCWRLESVRSSFRRYKQNARQSSVRFQTGTTLDGPRPARAELLIVGHNRAIGRRAHRGDRHFPFRRSAAAGHLDGDDQALVEGNGKIRPRRSQLMPRRNGPGRNSMHWRRFTARIRSTTRKVLRGPSCCQLPVKATNRLCRVR